MMLSQVNIIASPVVRRSHHPHVAAASISDFPSVLSYYGSAGRLCLYYKQHLLLRVPSGATHKVQGKPKTVAAIAVLIFVRRRAQPSLPSSTPGHGELFGEDYFDELPNVATSDSNLNIGIRFGLTFSPLKVDPLSVDLIEGHNRVSGKGFPTNGPRIEGGNVVIHRGLHVSDYWDFMLMDLEVTVQYVVIIGLDVDHGVWTGKDSESGFGLCALRICASFGSTRLICASFGSTRLMCASFGSTRLICASFGSTRLICVFYGTTRLLCRVRAQRGADRREAGRTREGHMDASGFSYRFRYVCISEGSSTALAHFKGKTRWTSRDIGCKMEFTSTRVRVGR
ncbi:hypothetical protein E6C27_scaffold60G001750 [Cucumis melo var. makuwa]|uniref:DNA-directed RNA polymerase I subunit RPA1-like n=1 Tax=Cucumis melo var. makuwa TaxID=1194695 RepID=A0A5A7U7N8_CUCMM|nr:hypothetical protein E6C27_scaffold60G001750 [Cucumis melo var. makuwa]